MNEKIPYLFHQLTGNRFTTIFWCSFSSILKPACLTKPFVTAAFFFLGEYGSFLAAQFKVFPSDCRVLQELTVGSITCDGQIC